MTRTLRLSDNQIDMLYRIGEERGGVSNTLIHGHARQTLRSLINRDLVLFEPSRRGGTTNGLLDGRLFLTTEGEQAIDMLFCLSATEGGAA